MRNIMVLNSKGDCVKSTIATGKETLRILKDTEVTIMDARPGLQGRELT